MRRGPAAMKEKCIKKVEKNTASPHSWRHPGQTSHGPFFSRKKGQVYIHFLKNTQT